MRRAVSPLGPGGFVWQVQYPEPLEGIAARSVAAGPRPACRRNYIGICRGGIFLAVIILIFVEEVFMGYIYITVIILVFADTIFI